jgi:gamma-glutamylcyclotransferase (GGCT)/AIG2-like uncharacterized protein YtfP
MKSTLRIFVYGTLKKGFSNHAKYCTGALRIEQAYLRGRLFKLTPQVPMLTIPAEDILAYGTTNVANDLEIQGNFDSIAGEKRGAGELARARISGQWRKIRGEVLSFDDAATRLPLIDDLEEFQPGGPSTYQRVLISATLPDGSLRPAWTYIAGFDTGELEECEKETWVDSNH